MTQAPTPTAPPPLIAVVGPVEPELLEAFAAHYRRLGVERFLLAFHFPEDTDGALRARLVDTCRRCLGEPALISVGAWHESTNGVLRDELRRRAGDGWHVLADVDEFQFHEESVLETVRAAARAGDLTVRGLLLDRVATDGSLPRWTPEEGLDRTYPIGGFVTHAVLGGDPRKVVAAHASVDVASGNHRATSYRPASPAIVPVHHFKWRAGLLPYLRTRAEMFRTGRWREATPAMRAEVDRLFDHLAAHGGRLDVDDPELDFAPASIRELPPRWSARAGAIVDGWRPRAYS
jgi:hypothetical protein